MQRRALHDAGAAFVIATMIGGVAGYWWLNLPANRTVVAVGATVVSLSPRLGSKNDPRPGAELSLRLDDGRSVTFGRRLSCLPELKPGDKVRLAGVRNHGGPTQWSVVGERCPR